MRNYIKKLMNGEGYQLLDKHINLISNYEGCAEWNWGKQYNQKLSNKNKPFFKGIFDNLSNKFDYKEYIRKISNERNFMEIENAITLTKGIKFMDCLKLMLITETYLGFLAEELVVELIKESGGKTKQSLYLDTKKKTDILMDNNIYLQLKNISFLDGVNGENRIFEYLKHNDKLCFLFYQISKENIIELVGIDGKAYIPLVELDGFSIHNSKALTIKEFKQKIR